MANKNDVKRKPFVPYTVNTNSAHQVEFTDRQSSHTGIELVQIKPNYVN